VELPEDRAFVVKPSVSAGARDTARYEPSQRALAEEHVRMLHASGRTAMVQPYLDRVSEGERALIFLGGSFSHAVRKGPVITEPGVIDNDRVPHPDLVPHSPSGEELATAEKALAVCPHPSDLLYARVDLILDDHDRPVVLELELVEPNLFCSYAEPALRNFADAVEQRLTG
jgi:glutathione synthase/RimK-type ligase-like ATP-grasp enzyme